VAGSGDRTTGAWGEGVSIKQVKTPKSVWIGYEHGLTKMTFSFRGGGLLFNMHPLPPFYAFAHNTWAMTLRGNWLNEQYLTDHIMSNICTHTFDLSHTPPPTSTTAHKPQAPLGRRRRRPSLLNRLVMKFSLLNIELMMSMI